MSENWKIQNSKLVSSNVDLFWPRVQTQISRDLHFCFKVTEALENRCRLNDWSHYYELRSVGTINTDLSNWYCNQTELPFSFTFSLNLWKKKKLRCVAMIWSSGNRQYRNYYTISACQQMTRPNIFRSSIPKHKWDNKLSHPWVCTELAKKWQPQEQPLTFCEGVVEFAFSDRGFFFYLTSCCQEVKLYYVSVE